MKYIILESDLVRCAKIRFYAYKKIKKRTFFKKDFQFNK
jgi:hypothetical protein